jgi:hypothetical protein
MKGSPNPPCYTGFSQKLSSWDIKIFRFPKNAHMGTPKTKAPLPWAGL